MATLDDLPTPAFLVDLDAVERNCARVRAKARASQVLLRPHVKTHKTIEGARLQLGGETGPITVSTLAEAEFYVDAGFRDITYAVPLAPSKLDRVLDLQRRIDALRILADHPDTVRAAAEASASRRQSLSVMIKIDCGYHRAGVDPAGPLVMDLARLIASSPELRMGGFLTHAGHSYHVEGRDQIALIAADEKRAVIEAAARAEAAGTGGGIRSVGSTPTIAVGEDFSDVDEIRPGNYIFFDAFQASIGACTWADCAASVLASIIAIHPDRRQIVIDAGALALSKDLGAHHPERATYGVVVFKGRMQPAMKLHSLSQEHGQIEVTDPAILREVRIGDKLRIIENHSCLTAAMYDRYYVLREDEVVAEWRPTRGW